jgi:hypothetical protein
MGNMVEGLQRGADRLTIDLEDFADADADRNTSLL